MAYLIFLISAIIQVETRGQNINGDGGQSIGYMQVRVATCKEMLSRNKSILSFMSDKAVFTALSFKPFNLACGSAYLRYLIKTNKTLDIAVNSYNTGNFSKLKTDTNRKYVKDIRRYLGFMYYVYDWLFRKNKKLLLMLLGEK
jgi:hypothetical protein